MLWHRYEIDDDGTILDARIVPPTSQNQLAIEQDLRAVVERHAELDDEELRHRCEQAIRNHDPCISCATHFLTLERRPLVIGVGNAARGDDAAGLLAARRLGGIELEGDPTALLDLFDGIDEAAVVDAVRSGAAPGTVHRFDVGAAPGHGGASRRLDPSARARRSARAGAGARAAAAAGDRVRH